MQGWLLSLKTRATYQVQTGRTRYSIVKEQALKDKHPLLSP